MDKSYIELQKIFKQIKNINDILAILSWDSAVVMPRGSIESRATQIATLKTLIYDIISNSKTLDFINNVNIDKLGEWDKANFSLMKKIHKQTIAIDRNLTEAHAIACTNSEMMWRAAKEQNNFKLFAPSLKEVLSLTKQIAISKASAFKCSAYDALLDIYDPGLTTTDIDPIFNNLKAFLPDFITQVTNKQLTEHKIKASKISLPINLQQRIGIECMKVLGFDFDKGRLDTSEHPFSGGYSEDTRITTKYKENDFLYGLMGILHETGHALYQQNLPREWTNQPVGSILGMATHESQSLIFEKQICKSKEFLYFLSNFLQEKFGFDDDIFKHENLYVSLNSVTPSFIRIEADEVTYPGHVILRYELEKAMISGELEIDDLPTAWNEKIYKTFGIQPQSDQQGCLQDIHWALGIFGYFPSYLIGAIMAAQLFDSLNKNIPNTPKLIAEGKFNHLNTWLHKNIHQCGSRYSTQDLLLKVTGEKLNESYYKKYLTKKFLYS